MCQALLRKKLKTKEHLAVIFAFECVAVTALGGSSLL